MISKKVCMLGAFAVGKTSLVSRYVKNVFSETYHTTIGVKIDKKSLDLDGTAMGLVLWDLAGEDRFKQIQMSYLKGAGGYVLVVDRTRSDTLETAMDIEARIRSEVGTLPFVLLANKSDLEDELEVSADTLDELRAKGWLVFETSAKTGLSVDEAFAQLGRSMLN